MRVYLVKRITDNKYYFKRGRWHSRIWSESFMTKKAARWHRTYWLNNYVTANDADTLESNIVIEEYEMVKNEQVG